LRIDPEVTDMTHHREYHAFLSYKHGNADAPDPTRRGDSVLARLLHRQLHRLARPFWKLRALHVFRDEPELAAGADLPGRIRNALANSDHFVLLASPEAAGSEWVRKEIRQWLAKDPRAECIIVALTAGDLRWEPGADSLTGHLTGDAIPPELSSVSVPEPKWVDLRASRLAAEATDPALQKAAVEIAARLHGCAPDELAGRDRQRLRQTVVVLAMGVVLLELLAGATWWQRERALDESARARAGQLAVESRVAQERDPREAAPLLVEALETLSARDLPIDYDVEFALRSAAHHLRDEIRFDSGQMSVRAMFPEVDRVLLVSADQVQARERGAGRIPGRLSALPLTDRDGYPLGAQSAVRLANGDVILLASNWHGETKLHRLSSSGWQLLDQSIVEVRHPAGIAVRGATIHVSDRRKGVFAFDTDGTVRAHWPMESAGLIACGEHEPCVVADRSPDFAGNSVTPGDEVQANARLHWLNQIPAQGGTLETPHAAVSALIYDGPTLLSGGTEGLVQAYEFDDGRLRRDGEPRRALSTPVTALASTRDRLAVGGRDGLIRVWGKGEEPEHDLRGHVAPIRSLAFETGDDCRLWSSSEDGQVRRWELCWPVRSVDATQSWERQSPDGRWLVRASMTDIERLHRGNVTRSPVQCAVAAGRMVEVLAISNRGDVLAKCPGTQMSQAVEWVPADPAAEPLAFPVDQHEAAWFVRDEEVIVSSGSFMTTIEGIEPPPDVYPARLQRWRADGSKAEIDLRPYGMALSLAQSRDGRQFYVGTQNGKLLTIDRARFDITRATELGPIVDPSAPMAAVKALACCGRNGVLAVAFGVPGMPSAMAEQTRDRLVLFDPVRATARVDYVGERRSMLALRFLSETRLASAYGPVDPMSGYGDSTRLRLFDDSLRPLAIDVSLPGAMFADIATQAADLLSVVTLQSGRSEVMLGLAEVEARVRNAARDRHRKADSARRRADIEASKAKGDHAAVSALASAWISADSHNPDGWQQRGLARLALGEHQGAATDFEAVLERDPWNLHAPLYAAKAYALSEDWSRAEAMAARAIERSHLIIRPPAVAMDSDHPMYATNRMEATVILGLQRSARAEPLLLRARVRLLHSNLQGARADLEEVSRLGVENDETRGAWLALQEAETKGSAP
jgi:tetratricopeptide (TPR) repeat protein